MDIKLLPNITTIPINNKKTNNKVSHKNIKIKGKVINVRQSRANEKGKNIITIITDSNENILKDIENSTIIITAIK